jgi:hypothetical protein
MNEHTDIQEPALPKGSPEGSMQIGDDKAVLAPAGTGKFQ